MSWKCPECGKVLKRATSGPGHMERYHGDQFALAEQAINTVPQLGGEIGRLRTLRNRDDRWDEVYHSYVKVSGKADTRFERERLRSKISLDRSAGRW